MIEKRVKDLTDEEFKCYLEEFMADERFVNPLQEENNKLRESIKKILELATKLKEKLEVSAELLKNC